MNLRDRLNHELSTNDGFTLSIYLMNGTVMNVGMYAAHDDCVEVERVMGDDGGNRRLVPYSAIATIDIEP